MQYSIVAIFIFLFALTEGVFVNYVNDALMDFDGCPAHRFRCSHSFSSSTFATLRLVFAAISIFHLTACVSFLMTKVYVVIMVFLPHVYGLVLNRHDMSISAWSSFYVVLHVLIFLGCRFIQELRDREIFILQLQILRLKSNLQGVLDSMVPRCISQRIRPGEMVVDAHNHITVLLCSFPSDPPPDKDAMQFFPAPGPDAPSLGRPPQRRRMPGAQA